MIQDLAKHLVESGAVIHAVRRNGGLNVYGTSLNPKFHKNIIATMGEKIFAEFNLTLEMYKDPQALIRQLEAACYVELKKQREANKAASPFSGSEVDVSKLRYVLDMTTDKEHLYHIGIRQISKILPSALKKILSPDEKQSFFQEATPSIFAFDPYDISAVKPISFESMSLTQFNLYAPPPWMDADVNGNHTMTAEDVSLPPIIHEFMEHVFPKKEARNFVWGWMHEALVGRAETYLVLNGKKGLGKGILVETLLQALVGEENFKLSPESLLTSDFNAALDKGRLVLLDEVRVDTDAKQSKLKRYINARQAIERKGVDADKVITTYNSFAISNNDIMDMKVYWDDRRFSVMDMNTKTLRDAWGQPKIDKFIEMAKDPSFQKQFGYYVLYHAKQPGQDAFTCYKGPHFYRLVYTSLTEWERVIVDLLTSKENDEYDIREARALYKTRVDAGRFPVKPQKIMDFLEAYLHEGHYKLGSLVEEGGTQTLYPEERYLPDTSNHSHNSVEEEEYL